MQLFEEILAITNIQKTMMEKLHVLVKARPEDGWCISPYINEDSELAFKCTKVDDSIEFNLSISLDTRLQLFTHSISEQEDSYKEAQNMVTKLLELEEEN